MIKDQLVEINRELRVTLQHLRSQNDKAALSITNAVADLEDVIRQLQGKFFSGDPKTCPVLGTTTELCHVFNNGKCMNAAVCKSQYAISLEDLGEKRTREGK